MIDATWLATGFTGLSGLMVAYLQVRSSRAGMSRAERREHRRENRRLEAQMLGIRRWAVKLEELLREHNIPGIPRRPPQMDLDWGRDVDEEEDDPPKRTLRAVGK